MMRVHRLVEKLGKLVLLIKRYTIPLALVFTKNITLLSVSLPYFFISS